MSKESLFTQVGPDGGPLYVETQLDRFIAEPFNGFSALLFLFIAIYWLVRLRHEYRSYPMLAVALGVLVLGGIGGTLFHLFRASRVFYLMDVVPIGLLTIGVSWYFWLRVMPSRARVMGTILPVLLGNQLLFQFIPRQHAISLSYAVIAALILLPVFVYLRRTHWLHLKEVSWAVGFFVVALAFRIVDPHSEAVLSTGTHWLWHLFSSLSVFFLIDFLHRTLTHPKQTVRNM